MEDAAKQLFTAVLSQCGLVSGLLLAGLIYQTIQLVIERRAHDATREAFLKAADSRAQAFTALGQALTEQQSGIRSILELKPFIQSLVTDRTRR